jgi:hypothetical protein
VPKPAWRRNGVFRLVPDQAQGAGGLLAYHGMVHQSALTVGERNYRTFPTALAPWGISLKITKNLFKGLSHVT